jgi:hypothetical protein
MKVTWWWVAVRFVASGDEACVGELGVLRDDSVAVASLGGGEAGWVGVAVAFA